MAMNYDRLGRRISNADRRTPFDSPVNPTSPRFTSPHLTLSPLPLTCTSLLSLNMHPDELIKGCEKALNTFQNVFYPLTPGARRAIEKCTALVKLDRNSIGKNKPKRRAQVILTHLWEHFPEGFILCALSTYPYKLGHLESEDYLQRMISWWEMVEHPKGLLLVLERYSDILPGKLKMPCTLSDTIDSILTKLIYT